MVDAGALYEHVGDEFCGDGRARLVLLVLARVREVGTAGADGAAIIDESGSAKVSKTTTRMRVSKERTEGRITYTTAVILRAEAIRRVCAMMQSLLVNSRRLACQHSFDSLGAARPQWVQTDSMRAPLVAVSGELAVATM